MSATSAATKRPMIVKEETFELSADNKQWLPTGKFVYVLYENSRKETVLTYRDKWVDIVACAKLYTDRTH